MGKNKAQRTKNNARPSSSRRSAELLGTSAPSFIGFTTSNNEEYAPISPGFSITVNVDVPPSFQIVFKKMNKKNATTKYKALQEFTNLCLNANMTEIDNMLMYWPRFYCSLSIDINHRVREAAQIAHATILNRVGKAIAVHLKEFAGPWFVSQYDTYPPVASAATNSFNTTFPPQKYVHAIVHCQDEILNYICDNIIVVTPQSLSTNNSLTPEEVEAQYQRLVTSSLQAYVFYLETVQSTDIEKTIEYHKKLICSPKFWKFAKNEVPSIRAACFATLTAVICHAYEIACEEKKKILTTVMNSLDETDPTLLIAVWECLLTAINKIEDWHKFVSIEKLVLPKLWRVLKSGGQNCASIVYPNLLPFFSFLSKLDMNTTILFTNFFENMRQGFSSKGVKLSRSVTTIVATSFFECFRYAILVNSNNEEICKCLLKEQLMLMIESCINKDLSMRPSFFSKLNSLLRYWSKNSDNPDHSAYSKLLKIFWFELMAIFNRLIDNSNENHNITTSFVVNSMSELLEHLNKDPRDDWRKMEITFWDSQIESPEPAKCSSTEEPLVIDNDNIIFHKQVEQFIVKLCVSYYKRITDKSKIIDLVKIIMNHGNKELLIALASINNESPSLLHFYDQNLRILLTSKGVNIEDLVNFIFIIMSYMENSEKHVVLQAFLEVDDVQLLKIAILYALIDKYREDSVIQAWLRQKVITNTLVLIAQNVLSTLQFTDSDEKLFVKAFEPALNGDLIVSNEAICGILSLFCLIADRLPWNNEKQSKRIVSLLSRLLDLSWIHKEINNSVIKLFKTLFRLLIYDNIEQNEMDDDSPVKAIVEEAWIKGLYQINKRMSTNIFNETIKYFTSVIWERMLLKNYTNDSLDAKEPLIDISATFIDTLIKINSIKCNEYIENFIMELQIKHWMKCLSSLVLSEEVITGNLYASDLILKGCVCNELFDVNLCNNHLENNIEKCLKWALYSSKIINKLLKYTSDNSKISEIFINISYAVVLGELYVEHNKFVKDLQNVHTLCKSLKSFLKHLGLSLPDDFHIKVISNIIRLLLTFGGIYQYILKFYYTTFSNDVKNFDVFINEYLSSINASNNIEISLQSTQVLWDSNIYKNMKNILCLNNDNDLSKVFLARRELNKKQELFNEVFEKIAKCQQSEPFTLLLDCDIHEKTWKDFYLPIEVITFFTECVNTVPQELTMFQWGIIEICIASWNLSIKKSINYIDDFKVKSLVIGVNKLYVSIQNMKNKKNLEPSLLIEWKDVFASNMQAGIFETWMKFAELYHEKKDLPIITDIPLRYLGTSLMHFDEPIIKADTSNQEDINKLEEQMIQMLLKLLYSPVQNLQIGTYITLNNIIDILVERDKIFIEIENFESQSLNICKFVQVLKTTQTIVNTMLMEFKPCDFTSCIIQPYTDSYTYAISYLLTWAIVLNMCAKANRDLRYRYAEILKEDLFSNLLSNLFRLIPAEANVNRKFYNFKEMFSTPPVLNFTDNRIEERIVHLVCYVYTMCLKYLPVLVRQWLSIMDKRVQNMVNMMTKTYISPLLLQEELEYDTRKSVDNMQIEKNPYSLEIVALYNLDDTKLELVITFPPNYPLCSVTVRPGQHVSGIPNQRNCHMQLSIFLEHQNGTIWDGLMLWKANLDKKFAGVEECYICFSIFHISTYQIPKLSCQTCRKKFHTSCLYKWFNKSYKSTCPLCRNAFPL